MKKLGVLVVLVLSIYGCQKTDTTSYGVSVDIQKISEAPPCGPGPGVPFPCATPTPVPRPPCVAGPGIFSQVNCDPTITPTPTTTNVRKER